MLTHLEPTPSAASLELRLLLRQPEELLDAHPAARVVSHARRGGGAQGPGHGGRAVRLLRDQERAALLPAARSDAAAVRVLAPAGPRAGHRVTARGSHARLLAAVRRVHGAILGGVVDGQRDRRPFRAGAAAGRGNCPSSTSTKRPAAVGGPRGACPALGPPRSGEAGETFHVVESGRFNIIRRAMHGSYIWRCR